MENLNLFFSHLIKIEESTATVEFIRQEVRRRWGESYILVTIDGLELEGSLATQGLFMHHYLYVHVWCALS